MIRKALKPSNLVCYRCNKELSGPWKTSSEAGTAQCRHSFSATTAAPAAATTTTTSTGTGKSAAESFAGILREFKRIRPSSTGWSNGGWPSPSTPAGSSWESFHPTTWWQKTRTALAALTFETTGAKMTRMPIDTNESGEKTAMPLVSDWRREWKVQIKIHAEFLAECFKSATCPTNLDVIFYLISCR